MTPVFPFRLIVTYKVGDTQSFSFKDLKSVTEAAQKLTPGTWVKYEIAFVLDQSSTYTSSK